MRASLDTNVIIHFYKAGLQDILFDFFDEHKTVTDFNLINNSSNLNWSFKSQVTKFINRFLKDPYRSEDTEWIRNLAAAKGFSIKEKLAALSKLL